MESVCICLFVLWWAGLPYIYVYNTYILFYIYIHIGNWLRSSFYCIIFLSLMKFLSDHLAITHCLNVLPCSHSVSVTELLSKLKRNLIHSWYTKISMHDWILTWKAVLVQKANQTCVSQIRTLPKQHNSNQCFLITHLQHLVRYSSSADFLNYKGRHKR